MDKRVKEKNEMIKNLENDAKKLDEERVLQKSIMDAKTKEVMDKEDTILKLTSSIDD